MSDKNLVTWNEDPCTARENELFFIDEMDTIHCML